MSDANQSLPADVLEALRRGNKIEAIKRLREQTGLGLKEAKDAVEASGVMPAAKSSTLAPGEVPRSTARVWLIIAVIAAALVVYYLLRGSR
jgi:hypothetical protein